MNSVKTMLEMTQPKVRKISHKALLNRALKAAEVMGSKEEFVMIAGGRAFGEWMSRPAIIPYFKCDNPIGLDKDGAYKIRDYFIVRYDCYRARLANGGVK